MEQYLPEASVQNSVTLAFRVFAYIFLHLTFSYEKNSCLLSACSLCSSVFGIQHGMWEQQIISQNMASSRIIVMKYQDIVLMPRYLVKEVVGIAMKMAGKNAPDGYTCQGYFFTMQSLSKSSKMPGCVWVSRRLQMKASSLVRMQDFDQKQTSPYRKPSFIKSWKLRDTR